MPTLKKLTTKSFWGTLRVFGFFAVVSGLSCVLLLNTARAEAEKRTRALGEKLLGQLGPLVLDEPTPFLFNGQQVYFASSLTPLAPQQVLARFEIYCHENSSGLAQVVGKLPSRIRGQKVPEELRDPATWFTVPSDKNDANYAQITCFARSEQTTLARFTERVKRFAESGDVSEIGDMRYIVARRATPKTTHVLAMWTEGSFKLGEMIADQGDAPGSDSPVVPRPPGSVRLLSAEFRGQPYAARIYETKAEPGAVLAFYDRQMSARGFEAEAAWKEHASDVGVTATPSYARAFTKNGALLVISALTEPALGDGTQVAIAELGTRGTSFAVSRRAVLP